MDFTHSWPSNGGVNKRRECPYCHRIDRILLKLEIVEVTEIARKALRTNKGAKKTSGDFANQQSSGPKRLGKHQKKRENTSRSKTKCCPPKI
jgi:hypothetical protein